MTRQSLANQIVREIHDIGARLIEAGLVDDQNFPARRDREGGFVLIESDYWLDAPKMTESIEYAELHRRAAESRSFDFRLLDGALIQMQYELLGVEEVRRARLAFLPAPDLTPYQTDADLYLHDEPYGDVVDIRAVTIPIRFDFDARPESVVDLDHPHSHLTLGQYAHCRIPIASALTPYYFFEFILRAFYKTAGDSATRHLPEPLMRMPATITALEQSVVHISVPCLP